MRAFRALALAAALTVSTTTAAFAGDGGGYARPDYPTEEIQCCKGDGGGYRERTSPEAPAEIKYGEVWA